MSKLPAFQFYPGDWLKDPNLRRCSHSAKGVWIDILCLMHESEERGYLATSCAPWSDDEIAMAVGGDKSAILACISELTLKGVAKRDARGALYSKRMVGDERKRRLCSAAGKRGGNPALLGQNEPTLKGRSKGEVKGGVKRNPTPSISSSSSDIEEREKESVGESEAGRRDPQPPTLAEIKSFAMTAGVSPECCEWWFNDMEGVGWMLRGVPVRKWRPLLTNFARKWQAGDHLRRSATKPSTRDRENERTGIQSTAGSNLRDL